MQNWTTILGIIDMRQRSISYNDCCNRYHVGHSTVKLIISRFSEIGKNLTALRQIAPEDVETSFYPPENIRRKEDFRHIGLCGYSRFVLCGREVNLTYISYSWNTSRSIHSVISSHSLVIIATYILITALINYGWLLMGFTEKRSISTGQVTNQSFLLTALQVKSNRSTFCYSG